jgi:putative transposase
LLYGRSAIAEIVEHSSTVQMPPSVHTPRLRRLDWLYTDRPLFFITTATHERRRLLDQDRVHTALVAFFENAHQYRVFVGRYVLMPDHLHCFATIAPSGLSLWKWVQILKVTVARTLRQQGEVSPFWQKGFFDHVLRSAESYQKKWEYVQQNPVRAGLVNRAGDWPYQGEVHHLSFN